jgi:IrrE N-terminal-like domain
MRTLRQQISAARKRSENPYALIEQLTEQHLEDEQTNTRAASPAEVSGSRHLLQDPYAHIGGDGELAGLANDQIPAASQVRSRPDIKRVARDLQLEIYRNRKLLWDGAPPRDPVEMLDPGLALRLIGYEYLEEDSIGEYSFQGRLIEAAGLIDNAAKRVIVSQRLDPNVRLFTAAHELGHAVLHGERQTMHRDRPLSGDQLSRDATERDADFFASCFLMPERLVRQRFAEFFVADRFVLNEDTAFALRGLALREVYAELSSRRDLAKALASAQHYNGRQRIPLATQFRVSATAMAIRLEELDLLG